MHFGPSKRRSAFRYATVAPILGTTVVLAIQSSTLPAQMPSSVAPPARLPARTVRVSSLVGMVKDSMGDPIAYAVVDVDGHRVTANDSGRFHVPEIAPGLETFTVRRLGYRELEFSIAMPQDSTVAVSIRLHRIVQRMREVTLAEKLVSTALYRSGYYERAAAGMGHFLSPVEVRERASRRVEELLYGIPGITVLNANGGMVALGVSATGYCHLALFVDGQLTRANDDGSIPLAVQDVHALEVYARPTEAPGQFHDPNNPFCGSLVIWTKVD